MRNRKDVRGVPVQNGPNAEDIAHVRAAGVAAGIGCSIVATIILFIGGGVLLDEVSGRTPLFILIGVALSLITAAYQLYELAMIGRTDRGPGPLGRQIARTPLGRNRPEKH